MSRYSAAHQWYSKIDYLRGCAILAVIAIHTSVNSITYFRDITPLVIINVAIDVFCHFAVPLFVFLSGLVLSLKYDRIDSVSSFYRKRLKTILPPYLVFSLLYLLSSGFRGIPLTLISAASAIATASSEGHLWFIAMIIQLYLLFPFLKGLCRLSAKGTILILLAAWSIQNIWIAIRILALNSAPFQGPILLDRFFASCIFYFVMGITFGVHFEAIQERSTLRSKGMWLTMTIILLTTAVISLSLIVGLVTYGRYSDIPARQFLLPTLMEPILYLSTGWLLFNISNYVAEIKSLTSLLLRELGRYSLGVYLIHYFYLLLFGTFLRSVDIASDNWGFYPIVFLGTVTLSFGSIKLMSYIPYSEYIIGAHTQQTGQRKISRESTEC